jgi:hypothetical protein
MSFITLAVKIDHGQLTVSEPERLPEKGSGLLTLLPNETETPSQDAQARIAAFKELSRSLNLDDAKAKAWMDTVRDARR